MLSKTKLTPITLTVSGQDQNCRRDPPAGAERIQRRNRQERRHQVKGLPVCTSGKLQARDTKDAEAICKSAIIGSGQAKAEIAFPEQPPIPATSKIVAFNGGFKGGVTTLYIHAYLTVPIPAAIVTTVKIKKIHAGRYGLKAISTIPKIAGGSGSVTDFNLTINKKGVLLAKCPDGKLQARGEAKFSDGTVAKAEVLRTCTGK